MRFGSMLPLCVLLSVSFASSNHRHPLPLSLCLIFTFPCCSPFVPLYSDDDRSTVSGNTQPAVHYSSFTSQTTALLGGASVMRGGLLNAPVVSSGLGVYSTGASGQCCLRGVRFRGHRYGNSGHSKSSQGLDDIPLFSKQHEREILHVNIYRIHGRKSFQKQTQQSAKDAT